MPQGVSTSRPEAPVNTQPPLASSSLETTDRNQAGSLYNRLPKIADGDGAGKDVDWVAVAGMGEEGLMQLGLDKRQAAGILGYAKQQAAGN